MLGAICLLVGLFALNLLPVNYAGLGLIGLGIALLVAETFTPTHGVLSVSGIAAFALGAVFLFESDIPEFTLSPAVIVTVTGLGAALALLAGGALARTPLVTGNATLIGRSGEVLNWSATQGEVHIHGERWRARAATSLVPGQRVLVIGREGVTLVGDARGRRRLNGSYVKENSMPSISADLVAYALLVLLVLGWRPRRYASCANMSVRSCSRYAASRA